MKKPDLDGIKTSFKDGVSYAREHGGPIAKQAVKSGQIALKTKMGKRIATGAMAGGAIAYALPLVGFATGAILGAGAMVLFKSLQDKED